MKKLISLTAAIALMISIINIPVSALAIDESFEYVVVREIYNDVTKLFEDHRNGDVTFSELISGLTTISINATATGFDYEANRINRLINGIQRSNGGSEHGGGGSGGSRSPISDIWDDICNKHNVPTETTQTSTTDMRGFGARYDSLSGGKPYCSKYGDYIIIKRVLKTDGTYSYSITLYPQRLSYTYPDNPYGWTSGYFENYVSNTGSAGLSESALFSGFRWYGDVRYEGFDEGEEPPPNDEFVYGTIHNFDDMDDKQISDLINDFSEELERQNPDLSNVEGLLSAIYSRLATLDSDDDNALLNAINTAIISLSTDTKASSAEIIELLKALKDKKAEGADLDPILKQLKDINKSLDYLKTVNTLDLVGDTIGTLLELTDSEATFLEEYANIIISLTAKLGYAPVAAMISNLEAIMLNGNPPQDIVTTIYDTEVVLLSSSVFDNAQIASALNLAKLFVSVLLAISWLYAMRKKITGGA